MVDKTNDEKVEYHPYQPKGLWIPMPVWDLHLCGQLSLAEMMMLVVIDGLTRAKSVGCWATNEYLGLQLNISERHASRMISKLKELELVEDAGTIEKRGTLMRVLKSRIDKITSKKWETKKRKSGTGKWPRRGRQNEQNEADVHPPVVDKIIHPPWKKLSTPPGKNYPPISNREGNSDSDSYESSSPFQGRDNHSRPKNRATGSPPSDDFPSASEGSPNQPTKPTRSPDTRGPLHRQDQKGAEPPEIPCDDEEDEGWVPVVTEDHTPPLRQAKPRGTPSTPQLPPPNPPPPSPLHGSEPEDNRRVTDLVKELHDALRRKHKISGPVNLKAWGKAYRSLLDHVGVDRLLAVHDWYCQNIGEQYVPHARSGQTFQEKFVAIEEAMIRQSPGKAPSEESIALVDKVLEMLIFPRVSAELLHQAVQCSFDSLDDFLRKRFPIPPESHHDELHGRIRACMAPEPYELIEIHLRAIHARLSRRLDWTPKLEQLTFTIDHPDFLASIRGLSQQYIGHSRLADELIALYKTHKGLS